MKVRFFAELLGTAFLLMIVVGSGIMAQRLFPGQDGAALLANSIATGAGLFVLIQCVGPLSGCHLNPVVTLVELLWGRLSKQGAACYALAQFSGAYMGILSAHLMFEQRVFEIASVERGGGHLFVSEFVATFGLISVIALAGRKHVEFAPLSIAAYITSAYWFTSSTSFANPAVTFGRMFTDTFCGINPSNAPAFVAAQLLGATAAFVLLRLARV